MAHISALDSGVYSYMDIFTGDASTLNADSTAADMAALFEGAAAQTTRMPSVREFPAVGATSNIVNVPVYGQAQSSQIAGQSDPASMEVTVNYIPEDMLEIEALKKVDAVFRFMMAREKVTVAEAAGATLAKENTAWYFTGRIETIQVTPSLSDSSTGVVTLSIQGDVVGPATIAAA